MPAKKHYPFAIVFDFGGVLIDWDPRFLYRKLFNGDEEAMERFLQEIRFFEWNADQDAGRPFSEAVAEWCRKFPQYCDLIRAYDVRYEESLSEPIWPNVQILPILKQAGFSLYGLSNWPEEKYRLVRPKYEFFNWFEDIIISGEVRMAKPDARIFTLLLDRINRRPSQCVMIDDSEKNISVANELGFRTIHYRSTEQLKDELHRLTGVIIS
jgi:2-haloacid dehalogenase